MSRAKDVLSKLDEGPKVDHSAISSLLDGLGYRKEVVGKYTDYIVSDINKFSGEDLEKRLKSRILDIVKPGQKEDKIVKMILDEI